MKWKPITSVNFIVVHCAATRPSMDIGANTIRRWHRQRGWLDIGYHYVIRRDGTVELGRPENIPGAHARPFNHLSLGICLVGGVTEDDVTIPEANFTPDQISALAALLLDMEERYPEAEVLGHRDLPNVRKACPSFDVRHWIESGEITP
jgi:N-acetylmuramoyl-L-alanine amidase